jgi:aspartate/methionine/tyrosine aminotransferase
MISRTDLNHRLIDAEYAVRGAIVLRAQQLEEQGRKIIYCNIGNPQALRQAPLSFNRQLLSLLEFPALLEDPAAAARFPEDIKSRVRAIRQKYPEGIGAYSQSVGVPFIRQAVADFIAKRDGIPASKEQIILTDGASKGVQAVILALLKQKNDGFMIPIPQYPLYSATLTLFGGAQVGYYLDESSKWQLREDLLEEAFRGAVAKGIRPVCMVVINPGNPTGGVLTRDNIEMVIRFAARRGLSLLADEVYQENIYDPSMAFYSFAKVMHEMSVTDISLFSVHSVSKGFLGECGHRGGYLECRNLPAEVMAQFVKLQSISLCANLPGQFSTYAMVAPPQEGDESYAQYRKEKEEILGSLRRKAEMLGRGINGIDGLSVDIPQGAMYAFVRLELPREEGDSVDILHKRESDYCLALLERTGICVVPGAGFGQPPGTLHFRTTFLPPESEMEGLVDKLRDFHREYTRTVQPVH